MTGDKFRARADRYIEAARAVTDPVHKLALADVAPISAALESVWVASPSLTKPAITLASKPSVVSNDCVMPSRPRT
jgi:hypothetical protein